MTYSADWNGPKFHRNLTFSGQAGTFLCFLARRCSATRSSMSDLTVINGWVCQRNSAVSWKSDRLSWALSQCGDVVCLMGAYWLTSHELACIDWYHMKSNCLVWFSHSEILHRLCQAIQQEATRQPKQSSAVRLFADGSGCRSRIRHVRWGYLHEEFVSKTGVSQHCGAWSALCNL